MTEQQLAQAFRLRLRGQRYAEIAEHLGLPTKQVSRAIKCYVAMLESDLFQDGTPPEQQVLDALEAAENYGGTD